MSSPGLRERKKARTRRTIQEQALRLFAEQGYEATTIEQIAEASEISPSTIFRYFPTKEDIVLQDDYDPLLIDLLAAQPREKPPLRALRDSFRDALDQVPEAEQQEILGRAKLQITVPAIRARLIQNMMSTMDLLADTIARREGADPTGLPIRTLVGATMGALLPAMYEWVETDGARPLADMIDDAIALLEEGLPIR
ncbi:acyl-CoA-like ligand-binding transcription factor [Acrocarpospora catenulata]|uniref:acyl-CoA-like ligand-binding transcription factor n=1 Tax=Acrocarpospora catenulata TaxID=2836182 RepID=UPI001BDAE810|nr:TetR family transcriptional regulator [Acrocarpospora catenulata]